MEKEKLIIEYMINYLKFYENNVDNIEDEYLFFEIRNRIQTLKMLEEEKIKLLNENMKKQLEG